MKHLGFDTKLDLRPLKRAFFLVGSFLFLSFFGAVLTPFSAASQPANTEFLQLDPEAVTHESLGLVTCLGRSPSDEALWIGMEHDGVLRVGRNGRRIRYTAASGHLPSDSVKSIHFLAGIMKACEKRPVSVIDIDKTVTEIERQIHNSLRQEISSKEIGNMVMEKLKQLDEVAYVRFASVHREFKDINTLLNEIELLVKNKQINQ